MHFHQAFNTTGIWTLDPHEQPSPDGTLDEDDPALPAIHRYIETKLLFQERCTYCHNPLEEFKYIQWDDPIVEKEITELTPEEARLAYCNYCGFWTWHSLQYNRGFDDKHAALSVLKEFDPSLPTGRTPGIIRPRFPHSVVCSIRGCAFFQCAVSSVQDSDAFDFFRSPAPSQHWPLWTRVENALTAVISIQE